MRRNAIAQKTDLRRGAYSGSGCASDETPMRSRESMIPESLVARRRSTASLPGATPSSGDSIVSMPAMMVPRGVFSSLRSWRTACSVLTTPQRSSAGSV
jgi:hypothetical protein